MKYRALKILSFTILSMYIAGIGNINAQEHKDYLLKKVGKLYVLNVGSNDSVKLNMIYNLYFEKSKKFPVLRFKYKTEREYFGAVQVTQIFPDYSVVRVVTRVMLEEPRGNKIILVQRELDKQVSADEQELFSRQNFRSPKDLQLSPIRPPKEIVKGLDDELKESSFKPFSLGFNYFRQLDAIAKPVTDNIIADIKKYIYNGQGEFSESFSSNGGMSFSLSKMLHKYVTFETGLSIITQNSDLATNRGEDNPAEEGLISVNNWDFNIETSIKLWTLDLNFSRYNRAVSYFIGQEPDRKITPRFGLGMNYASVDVKMKQNVSLQNLFNEELKSLDEKSSLGGYWGYHVTAGADYYLNAVRFFADLSYYGWFTDKFKSDIPFRIGASILF